jgi:hypothetical protein
MKMVVLWPMMVSLQILPDVKRSKRNEKIRNDAGYWEQIEIFAGTTLKQILPMVSVLNVQKGYILSFIKRRNKYFNSSTNNIPPILRAG